MRSGTCRPSVSADRGNWCLPEKPPTRRRLPTTGRIPAARRRFRSGPPHRRGASPRSRKKSSGRGSCAAIGWRSETPPSGPPDDKQTHPLRRSGAGPHKDRGRPPADVPDSAPRCGQNRRGRPAHARSGTKVPSWPDPGSLCCRCLIDKTGGAIDLGDTLPPSYLGLEPPFLSGDYLTNNRRCVGFIAGPAGCKFDFPPTWIPRYLLSGSFQPSGFLILSGSVPHSLEKTSVAFPSFISRIRKSGLKSPTLALPPTVT